MSRLLDQLCGTIKALTDAFVIVGLLDRVIHELLGQLTKVDLSLAKSPITAGNLGKLIDAVSTGNITGEFSYFLYVSSRRVTKFPSRKH